MTPPRRGLTRQLPPRTYWSVIDQGISSASNLVFVVVVARAASVHTFGDFALAYLLYAFALGGLRAVGGEILLLRAKEAPAEVFADCRRLLGLALGLGLLLGLVTLPIGLMVGGDLGDTLVSFAVVLSIVLTQDAMRYCLFALEKPKRAAVNDLTWLMVQAAVTAPLLLSGALTPVEAIFAWAAGAAVSSFVGLRQAGLAPGRREVITWISEDRARVGGFVSDFGLMTGSGYFAIYLVALIGGVRAVAGIRGATILFSPLDSLFAGVRIFTLPALAEAVPAGRRALLGRAGAVAIASAAMTATWAVVILTIPRGVGDALLGPTWDVARPLCPAIAVASVARYVALPAQAGLRVLNDPRRIVVTRAAVTAGALVAVVIGTTTGGARGAVIGLAAAYCLEAILWSYGFVRSSRTIDARLTETPAT